MPDVEPVLPWIKPGWAGVEIGVDGGASALRLLRHGVGFLWLIDPWENYPRYQGDVSLGGDRTLADATEAVKEFPGKTFFLRLHSANAVSLIPEVDFVWIDGDHRYEWVRSDLENYWPRVRPGGVICGHDYFDGGEVRVKKAVDEFAFLRSLTVEAPMPCWVIRKEQA
jgi:predicted O-methyltransferase YrrM